MFRAKQLQMATTRRNGQLSSCEPCRISKLRCDHTMPVCGRCTRRGLRAECIYHPAPLTRVGFQRPSRRQTMKQERDRKIPSAFQQENRSWNQKKYSVSYPGFLGDTSYSNALTDAASGFVQEENSSNREELVPMDSKRVNLGAQVLSLLANLPFYRTVVTTRFKLWEGWCLGTPLTMMIFDLVEEMWGTSQKDTVDQSIHALKLSKEIFRTHARPFETPADMSWSDFKHVLSGRWETIGLMFCITGLSTEWLSEDDSVFRTPESTDLRSLATMASSVSDICLQFCDSAGIVNDIMCSLLMHHTMLLTTVYGDSDSRPWTKLGELTTTVFALGLHQDSSNQVPFYLNELRKRTMVATFTIDKILATFLGRPPLVSWRYCDIQLPLDLSFEEMLLDPPLLREKILCLEANGGWNHEGTIRKGAWGRVCLFKGILREKVLELSLSYRVEDIGGKVDDLLEENRKFRSSLPLFLRWTSDGDSCETVPIVEDRILFSLHLDLLYNEFLLYRTIQKWSNSQPSAIIRTSREMLGALLSMVSKSSRLGHPVFDMGFSLCYFGLPAAGILSAELLRRSRYIISDISIDFPRSEIVQSLSVFSSHLNTFIQTHEGNYRISQPGQRMIRHILDQVLTHDYASLAIPSESSNIPEPDFPVGDLLGEVDANDRELFLDWMDGTVEHKSESWLRWINFS